MEKVLFYAPNDEESRRALTKLLRQYNLQRQWKLQPVKSRNQLQSSQLSHILQEALRLQQSRTRGPVVFLGMDAPELPLAELVAACFKCDQQGLMCPASDGGYCLLSVPPTADSLTAFTGVQWSHPLTALSQLKALSDQGVTVNLGPVMYDVDDEDDLNALCKRFRSEATKAITVASLSRPSLVARSVQLAEDKEEKADDPPAPEDEQKQDEPCKSMADTIFETLMLAPPTLPSSASAATSSYTTHRARRATKSCYYTRRYLVSIGRLPGRLEDEDEDDPLPELFTCGTLSPTGDGDLFHDLKAVWNREET